MKGIFAKLTDYKNNIAMNLLTNEKIIKAIVSNDSNFLDNPLPDNIVALLYNNIFPYKHTFDMIDEVKTFITMDFGEYKYVNNKFQSGLVTFYTFSHKSIIRTDYGLRYDFILNEINNLFNKEYGIGAFNLTLVTGGDFQVNHDYFGSSAKYKFTDFQ